MHTELAALLSQAGWTQLKVQNKRCHGQHLYKDTGYPEMPFPSCATAQPPKQPAQCLQPPRSPPALSSSTSPCIHPAATAKGPEHQHESPQLLVQARYNSDGHKGRAGLRWERRGRAQGVGLCTNPPAQSQVPSRGWVRCQPPGMFLFLVGCLLPLGSL